MNLTYLHAMALGLFGSEFINDNAAHTPPTGRFYWCFTPTETSTFTTLTDTRRVAASNNPADGAEAHPAGLAITGRITAITLASGAGWALLAPEES